MNPIRQPWYIRYARLVGAKNDTQATYVCLFIALILIIITIAISRQLFFSPKVADPIDPSLLQFMERNSKQR